jgi:hypothetical protein
MAGSLYRRLVSQHPCAGSSVIKTQNLFIMSVHGHEGLVETAVPRAKEALEQLQPAEPSLVARVEAKANIHTRFSARGQLVMRDFILAVKDCNSAAKGTKPGNIGQGAILSLPRCFALKSCIR